MGITMESLQSISTIARQIKREWLNVNYAAKPYLDAMLSLDSPNDSYGYDSGKSIVAYFLANASGYRGNNAKVHKLALKKLCGIK